MKTLEPVSRSSKFVNADDCFVAIIDVQEFFFSKELSETEIDRFLLKIIHLIKLAKILEIPILITAEDIEKNGSIPKKIADILPSDVHVHDKFIYSCWGQKEIQDTIKNFNRKVAVICGLETDVCIYQTTVDLLSNDYEVVILSDLTFSRNNLENQIGLKRMETFGASISLLKTWQEEITAGIRTKINSILKEHNLHHIPE